MSSMISLNKSSHQFVEVFSENDIQYGIARCKNCGVECLIDGIMYFEFDNSEHDGKKTGTKIVSSSCDELIVEFIINEWSNDIIK